MLTHHDSLTSKKTGAALALVASLFAFACGGDDSEPNNTGGAGPTGGTSSGGSATGGSTTGGTSTGGSGGASGGSGGAAGSSGAGALTPYACPGDEAPSTTITNFDTVMEDGLWGDSMAGELAGGTFNYGSVEHEFVGGALRVFGTVDNYSGAGLYINTCTDASAYKGVRFTISGNAGMMDMTFQLQTNPDYPIAVDPVASGEKGACVHNAADTTDDFSVCASPQKTFMAPGTVTVAFAELAGGKPDAMADPAQILGLQWQFAWSDAATEYDVDIMIDDVEFVEAIP